MTLIQSERTRVPPVTAERSPPLSRITGADSPVIADSSTEAMPSITSPSPGMMSASLDEHDIALSQTRSRAPTHIPRSARRSRLAMVSVLVRRRVSA